MYEILVLSVKVISVKVSHSMVVLLPCVLYVHVCVEDLKKNGCDHLTCAVGNN